MVQLVTNSVIEFATSSKSIKSYLNFLRLVLDDGLLVLQRGFQLLVALQQGLPQFRRQLEVCKRKETETSLARELFSLIL